MKKYYTDIYEKYKISELMWETIYLDKKVAIYYLNGDYKIQYHFFWFGWKTIFSFYINPTVFRLRFGKNNT